MKEKPERSRRSMWKALTAAAAVLAVVQACLTIEGRGIPGFLLWVLILFAGYMLLFAFLRWLWQRHRERS